jgi:hypothetical protein
VKQVPYAHPSLVAAAVLSAALAISVVSLLLAVNRAPRTLFFPRLIGRPPAQKVRFAGEERRIPVRSGLEARVAGLVREILLGPEDHDNLPLAGPGTRLLSVVAAGSTVYIGLTAGVLNEGVVVPPEKQVQAIADTVYFNFPGIKWTVILVDGQPPDFSGPAGDRAYDFRAGVPRSRLLLE